MVAKKIDVISKTVDGETNKWSSTGEDGYSIEPADKQEVGTDIVLYLRDDTEQDNYSEYLDKYTIESLVKKYSDYVRYPIVMECVHSKPKADNDKEYEDVKELETLNSMIPIWKKVEYYGPIVA